MTSTQLQGCQAKISNLYLVNIHRVTVQSDAHRPRQKVRQTQSQNLQPIIGIRSAFEENPTPRSALISSGVEWVIAANQAN
jgi:hypothetical protein